jgi:Na+/H+ antiporter NhaD/arsenite permease-like protein
MENILLATFLICAAITAVLAAVGMAIIVITDIIDLFKKRKND